MSIFLHQFVNLPGDFLFRPPDSKKTGVFRIFDRGLIENNVERNFVIRMEKGKERIKLSEAIKQAKIQNKVIRHRELQSEYYRKQKAKKLAESGNSKSSETGYFIFYLGCFTWITWRRWILMGGTMRITSLLLAWGGVM